MSFSLGITADIFNYRIFDYIRVRLVQVEASRAPLGKKKVVVITKNIDSGWGLFISREMVWVQEPIILIYFV